MGVLGTEIAEARRNSPCLMFVHISMQPNSRHDMIKLRYAGVFTEVTSVGVLENLNFVGDSSS